MLGVVATREHSLIAHGFDNTEAIRNSYFSQDAMYVILHGLFRQAQVPGNFLVGQAVRSGPA